MGKIWSFVFWNNRAKRLKRRVIYVFVAADVAYDPNYILLISRMTSEKGKMTATNCENFFSF